MNSYAVKKILNTFFLGSMIFFVTVTVLSGIQTTGQLSYWIIAFGFIFAANLLVPQVLKFLTLPRNFLTYWLMSATANFAAIYAISMLVPGFVMGETIVNPMSTGIVSVNPYTLSADVTMIFAGLISGLLNTIFYLLERE